jgi:hypothetical protein
MARKNRKPVSEMTAQEKKVFDILVAKKQKRKADRRNALLAVVNFVVTSKVADEATKKLAAFIRPRAQGEARVPGEGRNVMKDMLIAMFAKSPTIHEDVVFKDYRKGRAEMRKMRVHAIKRFDPAERLWISFEPTSGVYKLEGKGPTAPKDWNGYTPITVEGETIV